MRWITTAAGFCWSVTGVTEQDDVARVVEVGGLSCGRPDAEVALAVMLRRELAAVRARRALGLVDAGQARDLELRAWRVWLDALARVRARADLRAWAGASGC